MRLLGKSQRAVVDAELKEMEEMEMERRVEDSGRAVIARGCEGKCSTQNHAS